MQVADRWHLMENAGAAFLEAVRRSMPSIRQELASSEVDPALLTCSERIQHDGFLRRQESNKIIKDLAEAGASIKEITRRTGRSRKLIRSILRGADGDIFRCRSNMLEAHPAKLGAEWEAGCRNGAELWLSSRACGFEGGLPVVEWTTRRRRSKEATLGCLGMAPPA